MSSVYTPYLLKATVILVPVTILAGIANYKLGNYLDEIRMQKVVNYLEERGMINMPLDCSKCDAPCCRHVKADFLNRGDGCCKWLDQKQGICRIYDDRPTICNVDKYYEEHNLKRYMSQEEWYELNNECCEKLRELDTQKAH